MRLPKLALLCFPLLLTSPQVLAEELNEREKDELIAEGAMTLDQMKELDAQQFTNLFNMDSFKIMLTQKGKSLSVNPGVAKVFEQEGPTREQLLRLARDPMCGNKNVKLFAPNEDQVKEFLLAETQRLLASGQGGEARFISVNKGIRDEENPEGQTIKIYALEEGEAKVIFEANVSTGKEVKIKKNDGTEYCATTPAGFFRPTRVFRKYKSNAFDSRMPNAVFFTGGIALHATPNDATHQAVLGNRMSGGCVRLQGPEYATAMGFANDSQWDHSLKVRLEVMKSGKGIDKDAGNFTIQPESGRGEYVQIMNNTVSTQAVDRFGTFGWSAAEAPALPAPIMQDSWGTMIYVHY